MLKDLLCMMLCLSLGANLFYAMADSVPLHISGGSLIISFILIVAISHVKEKKKIGKKGVGAVRIKR